ncbi:ABC transporter permease [Dactylosporangium aurantiacum]|uniref:ABC transporter permease n=1 Tax=Dactylosporangium aurantiacum TaxID=35754 RepID=A0A9Q9MI71_9ACTN|nr:ABC transporter permease [Dactylosporangium aurantiacum]MDG6104923.1 ABC transporter permease [Dactylosporangium aurantiacum]UWZ55540.1 ABC transporter permease [Dactylosporangium aurantiacum]
MTFASVRHRWAGFLGTFVALLLGVAVISGSLTLWAAAQPRVPDHLAAADAVVASPAFQPAGGGFPVYRPWSPDEVDTLVRRLSATPGVLSAVPVRTFYAQRLAGGAPVGDPAEAVHGGQSWSSAGLGGYELRGGHPPVASGEVVVPAAAGVPVGAALPVLTAAGPATWTVTGVSDGPGLYVDDATAAGLADGVRVIGVRLAPGTSAAALDAGGLGTVLTGAARSAVEWERDTRTRWIGAQLIIATVLVGGFVAVFVVSSTCAFAVTSRRRELGLLRAVGATPGQVRRLLLTEIVVVALLAGVPGALLGAFTAPLLAGPFVAVGLEPAGFTVGVSWWALGGSVLAGLVVGAAGVWLSARRAGRLSPLDALRDAAVQRRPMTRTRWAAGGLAALAGGGLALLLPGATAQDKPTIVLLSAMALLVAAALLAPVLVVPLVRLLPAGRGATGVLVRGAASVAARRLASVAAPVLAAVGFAVLLVGTFRTASEAVNIEDAAAIPATAVAAGSSAVPGLSEAAVRAQRGASTLPTVVYLPSGEPVSAVGGDASFSAPAVLGFQAGQRVALRFADGTVHTLTVSAVAPASSVLELPRDLVRRHDPNALTPVVHLSGPFVPSPGATEMTARAYVEREASSENDLVDLFLAVLLGISVGYTALAVANTVLMATHARRQELITLHRTGATTGQTVRVVVVESLLAVVLGVALGLAVAVPALFEARAGLQEEIGAPVTLVMPWATLAAVAGGCALLAACASTLPFLRRRMLSVGARTMAG